MSGQPSEKTPTTPTTAQTISQKDDMAVDNQPNIIKKTEQKEPEPTPMEDDSEIAPDHNVAVFGPTTKQESDTDLPDDFYELTKEDLQYIMSAERRRLEDSSTLKTQKMRETQQPYKFKKVGQNLLHD
jgi:hypothetical protein